MKKYLVPVGIAAFLGLPMQVHACDQCNVYLGLEKHTVCGWWEGSLVEHRHCSPATPDNCNGHPWCPAEEDEQQQEVVAQTVGKLLGGDQMSFDELESAIALTPRIRLNEERYALQVVNCDGDLVVGHIPLDPITFSLLAQQ